MALFTPKTCFQMIPRTGTTWVRDAIRKSRPATQFGKLWYWETGPKHRPINPRGGSVRYPPMNPHDVGYKEVWDGSTIYCFVRHPVAWLRSRWSLGAWEEGHRHCGEPFCHIWTQNFPDFIEAYLDKMPGEVGRFFERYTVECTEVGRQEMLVEDFIRIFTESGELFNEKLARETPPSNFTEEYPAFAPGQVERICEAESVTMERFGYQEDFNAKPIFRSPRKVMADFVEANGNLPEDVRKAIGSLMAGVR